MKKLPVEDLQIKGKRVLKVVCWFDNEWGYACRVADLADYIYKKGGF